MDTPPPSTAPLNTPGAPPPPPRPGWWSRNWKWFVPTGCLTFVLLGAAFIAVIVVLVFGALKSTDVYKTAVARAKANQEVRMALGDPIVEGMFPAGSTNVEGPSGKADMSIPISGPHGSGTIYAVATKTAGRWSYSILEVEVKVRNRKDRIELPKDNAN